MRTNSPHVSHGNDRGWRVWSAAIIAILIALAGVLGLAALPVVQGRSLDLDAFTAICRAIGILPGTPAVSVPSSTSNASPVSQVRWTPEIVRVLHGGPRGNVAAAVRACAGCHGERGTSVSPQFPSLAGQSAFALYKQLNDYKTGARSNAIMSGIVQGLPDDQVASVAAHYAALPRGTRDPQFAESASPAIRTLVERGDPARGIASCASCHGTAAGGPIETPTLSGQRKEYLAAQLASYARGERGNDVYARMRNIAARLTPEEIEGLAAFYAGQ